MGIGINGKWDSDSFGSIQYNLYNYSINSINYFNSFGKGAFWRYDLGAATANLQVSSIFGSEAENSDWGFGASLGGGYSIDFKGKTRLLIGLYATSLQIDGESESYVNFMINGLW